MMLGFSSLTVFAGTVEKATFKVAGNCGMCETRIEKAAKSVDGVSAADWNKETKMIEVSFDDSETNIVKVHEAIANVGHDTEMVRADDETYGNLPSCCKYERMTYEASDSSGSAAMGHGPHMH